MMEFTSMLEHVALKVLRFRKVKVGEHEIDFKAYKGDQVRAIKKHGIDISGMVKINSVRFASSWVWSRMRQWVKVS